MHNYHITHKAFLACTIIGSTPSVLGRLLCPSQQWGQGMCTVCDVGSLHQGQFLWLREDGCGHEEAALGGMLNSLLQPFPRPWHMPTLQ